MKNVILLMAVSFTVMACNKKSQEVPVVSNQQVVAGSKSKVILETSMGSITLELDGEKAPISVANFLSYAKDGFYDGTIFHRVIKGFMIQGGGFDQQMEQKKTKAPIKNEASNGLSNGQYTISMARTNDPHSATAQFFINLVDNSRLNKSAFQDGYAVFGKVIEGSEIVEQIGKVKTHREGYYDDVPVTPVILKSVKVIQ
jgi:cyclophilin family peptidyl-prolyl cis-trans isomerase